MDFVAVVDQVIALLRQRSRVTYRTLQRQFQLDDDALHDLKDELLYAHPEVRDDAGRGLVWTGASPAAALDTRPQAEAERQFHTVLLAVMALLQREQRVTYRTLHYLFGVDEACLHAVRDELRFRQLAREEGGQGLVWPGANPPPAVSAPPPAPALALSGVLPRPSLPPPAEPRVLPGPPPALDGVSSLPVDDGVASPPDDGPVLTPAVARSAPDAERRQLTVLFCDLVGSTDRWSTRCWMGVRSCFAAASVKPRCSMRVESFFRVTMSVTVSSRPSSLHMTSCNLTRMGSAPPVRVVGE